MAEQIETTPPPAPRPFQNATPQLRTNRGTRYELVVEHVDGRRFVVAYVARRSNRGLADAIRGRAHDLIDGLGFSDDSRFVMGKLAAAVGPWAFKFSGKTERAAFWDMTRDDAARDAQGELVGAAWSSARAAVETLYPAVVVRGATIAELEAAAVAAGCDAMRACGAIRRRIDGEWIVTAPAVAEAR